MPKIPSYKQEGRLMAIPGIALEDATVVMASVAGATAATLSNRSQDTNTRKLCEGATGALVAIVCGPGIADGMGLINEHYRAMCYFGVATVGAILLTMFVDYEKSGSIKLWLSRFQGTKE